MTVSLTLILADVINDHTTQHAHQQLTHNGPFRDPRRVCIHRRPRGARRRCQAADNLRDCPRQQGTVQKMPRFAATCADLRLTHAARRAMLSCSPGPRSLRRTTLGSARFHRLGAAKSNHRSGDWVERRISHPPPFAPPLAWRIRARGVILTPRVRVGDHKHALCGGDAPFLTDLDRWHD